jgi:hypothetical protein
MACQIRVQVKAGAQEVWDPARLARVNDRSFLPRVFSSEREWPVAGGHHVVQVRHHREDLSGGVKDSPDGVASSRSARPG